jgi:hypothetical protein
MHFVKTFFSLGFGVLIVVRSHHVPIPIPAPAPPPTKRSQ